MSEQRRATHTGNLTIIADTREQKPYTFQSYPVKVVKACLPSGDYSIEGMETTVALERKSVDDLIGSITRERSRFSRELQRLQGYSFKAVVCECSFHDVLWGRYRSKLPASKAIGSIAALHVRYGVPFLWAGNRPGGERLVYELLRRCHLETLTPPATAGGSDHA